MILETARLRLRPWVDADRPALAAINADPAVMRHFPAPLTRAESDAWMERLGAHYATHHFTFWAVRRRAGGPAIGAVGLLHVPWEAAFTPAVEIGWRIATAEQRRGFAAEAARAILEFGFDRVGLESIVAVTVPGNTASLALIAKLRFVAEGGFDHPRLPAGHPLRPHLLFRLNRTALAR